MPLYAFKVDAMQVVDHYVVREDFQGAAAVAQVECDRLNALKRSTADGGRWPFFPERVLYVKEVAGKVFE